MEARAPRVIFLLYDRTREVLKPFQAAQPTLLHTL